MKKFEDLTLEELQNEYNQLKDELLNEVYPNLAKERKKNLSFNPTCNKLQARQMEITQRIDMLTYRIDFLKQNKQ